MTYNCRWGNAHSEYFTVKCGSKQGGILSPDFFSLYINDLVQILRKTGIGCHMISLFIACILFADDVTLMAPTRDSMQTLLNICAEYCSNFCLKFNAGKTKLMVFGKLSASMESLASISLHGEPIDYVTKCKFLGFHILSGKTFRFSVHENLCGFFGSVNSILSSMSRPKEHVQLQLLFSNCVPKLTYGAAVKDFSATEKQRYNVALNNAIRRVFGFRRWESIRQLRECYGFQSIEVMIATAKKRFLASIANHNNLVLRSLYDLNRVD